MSAITDDIKVNPQILEGKNANIILESYERVK